MVSFEERNAYRIENVKSEYSASAIITRTGNCSVIVSIIDISLVSIANYTADLIYTGYSSVVITVCYGNTRAP